jgi:hypothetical protein
MIKCFFIILAGLSLAQARPLRAGSDDDWFDPAFLEANTLMGGTGFINVPSAEILPAGVVGAAIHRYQAKIDYGLWDYFELGVTANLDGYLQWYDGAHDPLFYARLRLLSIERQGIGLSVGVDGVGLEDLGFGLGFVPNAGLENLQRLYAVAGAPLPLLPSWLLTLGWGAGAMPTHYFFNLSKVLIPGLLGMVEYDGFATNYGARFLLSTRIKLDVAVIDSQGVSRSEPFANVLQNNIRFGITYTEPWTVNLAYFTSSGKKDAPKNAAPKP